MITHPYGSTMRSILVAVYMLGVEEVIIMGHTDCGFGALKPETILSEMKSRGISDDVIDTLMHSGIDVVDWLQGFVSAEESFTDNDKVVKKHHFMFINLLVHLLVCNLDSDE